ncbi:hypothetical protein DCCM_4089 [Desulfocucumis palustris]|uniref:Uncharacterized protein n=1 Tax=Desulfocucumis palustris TaxID=1898651 RepID=A0A2L2XFF0_9FIRM|nr:hypothetical protein DCCM_4089 [Desulfocucumis palustris]
MSHIIKELDINKPQKFFYITFNCTVCGAVLYNKDEVIPLGN